jgi:hypothetical protein
MNERIKELEKQCWSHRVDGTLVDGQLHFDTQKFAVLIVRECARIAIEKQTKNDILNIVSENPAKDFAYALVEHFGVEE